MNVDHSLKMVAKGECVITGNFYLYLNVVIKVFSMLKGKHK